eukprot:CAMPEP_0172012372 /NCGR_PEP_ID=MMETSP1041-20130122/8804_1 /TAXON_ID=464988 /ORGANISM="Hemiselmis andersenii, Strain CCMP439" /LENGTH=87 /DNA_ID=CAMNT_0012666947 /DNA_START=24 /DNA_END=283 /DNA_ORIENTATION=-
MSAGVALAHERHVSICFGERLSGFSEKDRKEALSLGFGAWGLGAREESQGVKGVWCLVHGVWCMVHCGVASWLVSPLAWHAPLPSAS